MNTLQAPAVYLLLARRIRRGMLIFHALFVLALVLFAVALAVPGQRAWGGACYLLALFCWLGVVHVRKRNNAAWKVAHRPHLVYWAHPVDRKNFLIGSEAKDCTLLQLHLRDGAQFEVGLPPDDMRSFVDWLREQNPTVRWGAYDDVALDVRGH